MHGAGAYTGAKRQVRYVVVTWAPFSLAQFISAGDGNLHSQVHDDWEQPFVGRQTYSGAVGLISRFILVRNNLSHTRRPVLM